MNLATAECGIKRCRLIPEESCSGPTEKVVCGDSIAPSPGPLPRSRAPQDRPAVPKKRCGAAPVESASLSNPAGPPSTLPCARGRSRSTLPPRVPPRLKKRHSWYHVAADLHRAIHQDTATHGAHRTSSSSISTLTAVRKSARCDAADRPGQGGKLQNLRRNPFFGHGAKERRAPRSAYVFNVVFIGTSDCVGGDVGLVGECLRAVDDHEAWTAAESRDMCQRRSQAT